MLFGFTVWLIRRKANQATLAALEAKMCHITYGNPAHGRFKLEGENPAPDPKMERMPRSSRWWPSYGRHELEALAQRTHELAAGRFEHEMEGEARVYQMPG